MALDELLTISGADLAGDLGIVSKKFSSELTI
jgi:hypothetical protein